MFLLSVWVLVCVVFTQGYLAQFPFDYNRFLYFLILPLLVFIAVLIDYGSEFFAHIIDTYQTLSQKAQPIKKTVNKRANQIAKALAHKNIYTIFSASFLIFSFVALPIFMSPIYNNVGESIQSFYQTMDNQGWEALQWTKNNTARNAVFVTDALYGWWLGGFAQRPTLSAVDPQFLSLNREVDNATFARNILDTDYMIDNGYLQVREDGGYLGRHNPEFLAKIRNEYYPFPFFNFNNTNTIVTLQDGKDTEIIHISDMSVLDMHLESTANSESIVVTHGNTFFNYTQKVTMYAESVLANVTERFTAVKPEVGFVTLQFGIATKSSIAPFIADDHSNVGLVDIGMKTMAQLSFPSAEARPAEISNSDSLYLTYKLNLASSVEFSFYAGTYQYTDKDIEKINDGILDYTGLIQLYSAEKLDKMQKLKTTGQDDFTVFDYHAQLSCRQVSYVIVFKNPGIQPKFTLDPQYSLVFINKEAAIYRVNG